RRVRVVEALEGTAIAAGDGRDEVRGGGSPIALAPPGVHEWQRPRPLTTWRREIRRAGAARRKAGRAWCPLLPELESLDLPGSGLGQLAHELDPAWILVRRDLVLHELLDLGIEVGAGRMPVLEHDEGLGLHEALG